MIRFRNFLPFVVILAVGFTLTAPSKSEAAFQITITVGANTLTIIDDTSPDTSTLSNKIRYENADYFGYEIDVTAKTNSPGGFIVGMGNGARITETTITIKNVSSNDDIVFNVFSDGFTTAGVGEELMVWNEISASALDPNSPSNSSASVYTSINGSVATPTAAIDGFTTGSASDTTFGLVTLGSSPFSLENEFRISGLAQGGMASITATSTAVVPAPAGIILALIAAPVLGFGGWVRRRRQQVVA